MTPDCVVSATFLDSTILKLEFIEQIRKSFCSVRVSGWLRLMQAHLRSSLLVPTIKLKLWSRRYIRLAEILKIISALDSIGHRVTKFHLCMSAIAGNHALVEIEISLLFWKKWMHSPTRVFGEPLSALARRRKPATRLFAMHLAGHCLMPRSWRWFMASCQHSHNFNLWDVISMAESRNISPTGTLSTSCQGLHRVQNRWTAPQGLGLGENGFWLGKMIKTNGITRVLHFQIDLFVIPWSMVVLHSGCK